LAKCFSRFFTLIYSYLSKQYVCEHGTDFDEKLWFTSYSDEVLDNPEDEGGKPFTGLAYELHDNGNLGYYCYYKNGFAEGNYVEFYPNGNIKSECYMVRGQVRGTEKVWYESGEKI
jgi:antitoxin component YwqK of YwqJK toxin-antitoxin module